MGRKDDAISYLEERVAYLESELTIVRSSCDWWRDRATQFGEQLEAERRVRRTLDQVESIDMWKAPAGNWVVMVGTAERPYAWYDYDGVPLDQFFRRFAR